MMLRSLICCALFLSTGASAHHEEIVIGFESNTLDTKLPKPLSDFTAVMGDSTAKVYLSGGCDSTYGNRFNESDGRFLCESISNQQYIFDINTQEFSESEPMPTERYRHAAVLTNNQVWLVGGRSLEDDIITDVDVYDIEGDNWTTYNTLDEAYQLSDLAGFVGPDGKAYFAGGYNFTYAAQTTTFSIDPIQTTATGALVVEEHATLTYSRGDVAGVADIDDNGISYALLTGGFTHENDFCEPLGFAERYDFDSDMWTEADELNTARGEKALVVLNDRVYGIGGERQIANICTVSPDDPPEPGEQTVPVDDVEWYNADTDEWTVIQDLPQHRFRFAAVGYGKAIYTFGGQVAYDESCMCFKTSDEVTVYTEILDEEDDPVDAQDTPDGPAASSEAVRSHSYAVTLPAFGIALLEMVVF